MGDAIQFIRVTELLKRQGATVLVECLPPLVPLLRTCPWGDRGLLPVTRCIGTSASRPHRR